MPRPTIIEKPSPEYQRMDLYNDSPHIVVSAGDIEETLIHIAFQNLSITVPMEIEIHTAAHPDEMEAKFDGLDRGEMESHRFRRQLLHDYAEEVQKIILLWQHDPNIYLVGDFEDEDEEETLRYWDRDSDIELSIENDNPNSAYGDGCLEITGTAIYNIPDDIEDEETNPLPLIPRPTGRLRVLKLFAKAQDTTTDLIVKLVFPPVLDMDNNEIHNGEIILVDGRTMSDEYEDYWLDIESEMKKVDYDFDIYNVQLHFEIPSGKTAYLDQVEFSTCEYQMLLYQRFRPNNETFGYYNGVITANFRSEGDPIDRLM